MNRIETRDAQGKPNGYVAEEWRRVEGYDYEVSSCGRVRKMKPHKNFPIGYILKPKILNTGYPAVALFSKYGFYRHVAIHVLVCEAFHGKRPTPAHQVAHWDGSRDNCKSDNLRWATPHENSLDKRRHGTMPDKRGEKHHMCKLNEAIVREMRDERARTGESYKRIADRRGIPTQTAQDAIRGVTWGHLENSRMAG